MNSDDEDQDEFENEHAKADAVEEARVALENLAKVPPFVPLAGWLTIPPLDSQEELDAYSWTGRRLAKSKEDGALARTDASAGVMSLKPDNICSITKTWVRLCRHTSFC